MRKDCTKANTCRNCEKTGHYAQNCEDECKLCDNSDGHIRKYCQKKRSLKSPFSKDLSGRKRCDLCGATDHLKGNCKITNLKNSNVKCFKCKNMGHISENCTYKNKCYTCGAEGHTQDECSIQKDMKNIICYDCSEMGHFSRDCPKKSGGILVSN
ncbi:Cellular nucleic acid-binding protein-like [Armadillidium vulgare]|nr:Cellular nucleic acid-binding protein-like [Armadillidium vulgare]